SDQWDSVLHPFRQLAGRIPRPHRSSRGSAAKRSFVPRVDLNERRRPYSAASIAVMLRRGSVLTQIKSMVNGRPNTLPLFPSRPASKSSLRSSYGLLEPTFRQAQLALL